MPRFARKGILLLAPVLTFAGLIVFLHLWAVWFRPAISTDLPEFDPEEVAEAKKQRRATIDPDNPVVIWQDVDYSEGETATWWPKGEAPVLSALVESGLLPPLEERVGPEPVVLEGVDGIGRYGGSFVIAETASTQELVSLSHRNSASSLVRWSPYGYPIVPHLAKSWEIRDQYREFIFFLRKGVRWSDGHPLTTKDIIYYWEHEVGDSALNIRPSEILVHIGKEPVFTAIDDYTLSIRFEDPHPAFLEKLATQKGQELLRTPAHFRSRYHPTLGDPEFLRDAMSRFGTPSGEMLYQYIKRWNNPAHPRLWPWVYRTYKANPPHVFVRNPYYYAVDREGNQLPYIDQYIMREYSGEMGLVAAVNGELSFSSTLFSNYSLVMSQRESGGYSVYHWDPLNRSDFVIYPNQNLKPLSKDPVVVQKRELIQNKKFRQAMSLAIDREFISRVEYSGLMEPAQMAPSKFSPYYEEALAKAFVEFDPDRSGRLLDTIGLEQWDEEGMRTLPDGSRLTLYLDYLAFAKRDVAELIAEYMRAIGLRVTARYRNNRIWYVELDGLALDLGFGARGGKLNLFVEPQNYVAMDESHWARGYGRWYSQGGLYGDPGATKTGGIEPPSDSPYYRVMEIYDRAASAPTLEEQKEIVRDVLLTAADHLWTVNLGIVPPLTMIVKNGLNNLPRLAVQNADFQVPGNCGIETFFWDESGTMATDAEALEAALTRITPMPGSDTEGSRSESTPGSLFGRILARILWSIVGLGLILVGLKHPFIGRRFLIMVPTLLVVSICAFVIIQLPPGDFLTSLMAQLETKGEELDMRKIEDLRGMFELDDSVTVRYLEWIGLRWFLTFKEEDRGMLQGDMGLSMESQNSVNDVVGDRIVLTLIISLCAILFTWAVALPIGVYSAVRQYSVGDYLATFIGFVGMSVPNFLLALIVMYLSNLYFGVPISGLFSAEFAAQSHWNWPKFLDLLKHVWVPVVVLGVTGTAGMIRIMRGNLLDELKKPYVITAMAKGVRPLKLLVKYPVRLALNPFISGLGALFPQLVSGGAIVALILSLPTVGPLLLRALQMEDMYLAGSMLLVLSLLGILGTLVSDLLLLALDPRIRMEEAGSR